MENLAAKKSEIAKLELAIVAMLELRAKHAAQGALETVRQWDVKIARFQMQVAYLQQLGS